MSTPTFPLRSTFVAIPLEGQAKEAFSRFQQELEPFERCLTFQSPSTPHLTLQFWREVMEIEYTQIQRQLAQLTMRVEPFTLLVEGVDTFGVTGDAKVLYLTVPFSEPLARLKKLCPWPPEKTFQPHITLARIRHAQRFEVARKKIFKLLGKATLMIVVERLRLYAAVKSVKQMPLLDAAFSLHHSSSSSSSAAAAS